MDDVKELAIQKQAFLKTDFGQKAAEEINKLVAHHYQQAESPTLKPWQKAYHIERAAGINEVVSFFTADVALLEAGYFDEKKEETEG